jgi:protease PrsW
MEKYLFIILLSLVPSIFWIFLVEYVDKKNPEPKKEIIKCFAYGAVIVLPAFLIIQQAKQLLSLFNISPIVEVLILSFVIDGLLEELTKFSVMRSSVCHCKFFDEPIDGLVYGVTIAMGFAFTENFLYLLTANPQLIIVRFATPTLMHAMSGGIIGYHMALAKFRKVSNFKRFLYISSGILLAAVFHGSYNAVIRYNVFYFAIPIAFLLIGIYFYLLRGVKKAQHEFEENL